MPQPINTLDNDIFMVMANKPFTKFCGTIQPNLYIRSLIYPQSQSHIKYINIYYLVRIHINHIEFN